MIHRDTSWLRLLRWSLLQHRSYLRTHGWRRPQWWSWPALSSPTTGTTSKIQRSRTEASREDHHLVRVRFLRAAEPFRTGSHKRRLVARAMPVQMRMLVGAASSTCDVIATAGCGTMSDKLIQWRASQTGRRNTRGTTRTRTSTSSFSMRRRFRDSMLQRRAGFVQAAGRPGAAWTEDCRTETSR